MPLHPEFVDSAYSKTIFGFLAKKLRELVADDDTNATEELLCDEVPFQHRKVTREALIKALRRLTIEEHLCTVEMEKFQHVRADQKGIAALPPEEEEPEKIDERVEQKHSKPALKPKPGGRKVGGRPSRAAGNG